MLKDEIKDYIERRRNEELFTVIQYGLINCKTREKEISSLFFSPRLLVRVQCCC